MRDGRLFIVVPIPNIGNDNFAFLLRNKIYNSSSYMALQPISGLGLLFMRFLNLTLIDNW
jgi:hypothetical protein